VGFDWGSRAGVSEKIREELGEFLSEVQPDSSTEIAQTNSDRALEEFGDLLFTLAQYARHMGLNAEVALQRANTKFIDRFRQVERLAQEQMGDKPLSALSPAQLEELWKLAKSQIS
jgi:tetrapyrrole methylase family protein/MazG family protein